MRLSKWLWNFTRSLLPAEVEGMEQDYWITFTSDSGKRVLYDLVAHCYHTISFIPGDSYATAFNEGQRAVVHRILETIDRARSPIKYVTKVETEEKRSG